MKNVILKTGPVDDFFRSGRKLARLADHRKPIPERQVLSFEDPADLLRLLTNARVKLLRQIQAAPGSISSVAQILGRDRSAVKRDVDELAKAGLLEVTEKALPGHGRMKEVRSAAARFRLEAAL